MTATKLVLVDSSGWIEAIGDGPKSELLRKWIEENEPLIMPTIVLYEVGKKLMRSDAGASLARFQSHALRQIVIPLDEHLAGAAARVSLRHELPMADAIIYATALTHSAELVTTDSHFAGLPSVTIV